MNVLKDVSDKLCERGVVEIHGAALPGTTLSVARSIGELFHLNGIDDVQVLRPRARADAPLNIYSGNYGYDEFPLHTDLAHLSEPPKFLLLRSRRPDPETTTLALDSADVISTFGELALRRTLVQPRRSNHRRKPLLRLLERRPHGSWLFRWDRLFLVPATPKSAEVFEAVKTYFETVEPMKIRFTSRDDTLIIDNHRILHGRSAVSVNSARCLERLYLRKLK